MTASEVVGAVLRQLGEDPNSDFISYPASGHGAVFQFHADCVARLADMTGVLLF